MFCASTSQSEVQHAAKVFDGDSAAPAACVLAPLLLILFRTLLASAGRSAPLLPMFDTMTTVLMRYASCLPVAMPPTVAMPRLPPCRHARLLLPRLLCYR